MAHFAKIGNKNIVEKIEVVSNDIATTEQAGIDFLNNLYGTNDIWKQTSYNTYAGEHLLGGTPFRKNFAMIGGKYDEQRDAFIPKKTINSWVLNPTTCQWDAPKPMPTLTQEQMDNNKRYEWSEHQEDWILK